MMIVVAISAMVLAALMSAARMGDLARAYRAQARYLAESRRHDLRMATAYDRQSAEARARDDRPRADDLAGKAAEARRYASQFDQWSRTYRSAASHPRSPLPPDTIGLMVQAPPSPLDIAPYTLGALGLPSLILVLSGVLCLAVIACRATGRKLRSREGANG